MEGASVARVPSQAEPAVDGVLIEIRNLRTELRLRKKTVHAVNNLSLTIKPKETLGLVGESGSGKSMLALSIMRLLPSPFGTITAGEILFDGQDLASAKESAMRRIRGNRISMVFQEPMTSLDPLFTIGSQITETIRAHRQVSKDTARKAAIEMLERVRIPSPAERFDSYPHELSGGMRQRAMIAIALSLEPELLLADEPTTALDVTVQAQILALIAELQAEMRMGVLLITHNLAVVGEVADRVAVMYAGEIVETAPAQELFDNPRHPYTQGLLRSIPIVDRQREYLHMIPGRPPDLTREIVGCPFAPRCPYASRGKTDHPELKPEPGNAAHEVRCWNPHPFDER
ncbi:MAG: ABC transporter ATP-binding protein [Actinomycetota bacterium]